MLAADSRTNGVAFVPNIRINLTRSPDSLPLPRGEKMSKYVSLNSDPTQAPTSDAPGLGDADFDVADLEPDLLISISSLSLRHAREHLRVCVAYNNARTPHTEFARRLRRALTLVNDALENIS